MAKFTVTASFCGKATIEMTYDDVEMKLVGIKLTNNSNKHLDIFLTDPLTYSKRLGPGINFERILTSIEKPTYNWVVIRGVKIVSGIEWRGCLGI